jgi:hypothetical protein
VSTLSRDPTFLPLTASAATVAIRNAAPQHRAGATLVQQRAMEVDHAAAECWASLLAGCDTMTGKLLPGRLRALSEATSRYAGAGWWFSAGCRHRERVDAAQARIEDAVAERDGEEFAEAFIGYDLAVATAVAKVHARSETPAR